jgi:hypothetical protein
LAQLYIDLVLGSCMRESKRRSIVDRLHDAKHIGFAKFEIRLNELAQVIGVDDQCGPECQGGGDSDA